MFFTKERLRLPLILYKVRAGDALPEMLIVTPDSKYVI